MSFGMPVNPELNPQSEKEEENHANGKISNCTITNIKFEYITKLTCTF